MLLFLQVQIDNVEAIVGKHHQNFIFSAAAIHPTTNYGSTRLICEFSPPTQVTGELPTVGRVY